MTDLEAFTAMLTRAGIPYRSGVIADVSATGHSAAVPVGSTSVTVPSNWVTGWQEDREERGEQPYSGGYSGFFAEAVFGPDGALLAVWAWE